jgi:signal transduction histidine kinase
MALGVCGSIALLTWFAYRAIRQWQQSSALVIQQRTDQAVNLLSTALAHDMRAVQRSVLPLPERDSTASDSPKDLGDLVASAFARYPYPESFFYWREHDSGSGEVLFLQRSDRLPPWALQNDIKDRFPVSLQSNPAVARTLATRIAKDASRRRRFSTFDLDIARVRYQVVAKLFYRDTLREHLAAVFGFTVNIPWVRQHYFQDLMGQVAKVNEETSGLQFAIFDDRSGPVAATDRRTDLASISRRPFAMMFFDPLLVVMDLPDDLPNAPWFVQAGVTDDAAFAIRWTNRTLLVSACAGATLALGLVLTARAVRTKARLAEMRSDFVSTVTHELKTPIATIRAVGDTLASGRIRGAEPRREYAQLVVQEAKRLTRLVDNLLAYSRITDVTEAYSFEPLEVAVAFCQVQQEFNAQLRGLGFELDVAIPENLPFVRADRTAVTLLLNNLVDNAIRYSGDSRWIGIRASANGSHVAIDVSDRGQGIPASELDHVKRRFFRGKAAGSGGSGLGLAIAERIVEDHGGSLAIRSQVRGGTTVTFTLPTLPAEHVSDDD